MFGSTLQESVPTCVQAWAAAGAENVPPKESVHEQQIDTKHDRPFLWWISVHNVSLAVDNHLADDLGHCVQGLLVRIDQTMLDEFVALVVKNINVEFGVSRLAEQKSPQERNRGVAVGAALPHNILARILFDRAVPSVLSCGRIRRWSPLKDDCCKNGCYPFHVVPFNCSCSDATNRCSACHCSGRQSRRALPDRFPVLLKKNHPQSSDSSGNW